MQEGIEQAEQSAGPEYLRLSGAQRDWNEEGDHSTTATVQITLSPCFGGIPVLWAEEGSAPSPGPGPSCDPSGTLP